MHPMRTLRFLLGDQLARVIVSLTDLGADDVVLMVEADEESTYAPHRKQRIALVLAATRTKAAAAPARRGEIAADAKAILESAEFSPTPP